MTFGELVAHRVERLGGADAGNDVFTLGVGEEVAVAERLAGRGIAGERHTGTGVVALVAEHHGLHVDRRAEVVGDLLHLAVHARPLTVPALEHRFDGVAQLLLRVLREVDASVGLHDALERLDETGEVFGGELRVGLHAALVTQRGERMLEALGVDVEHDLAEHLHEPAVRVVGEPLVLRLLGEALHRRVVEPEVEDGVHHPRHRERCTRAHRHQQRVGFVTERLAHLRLRGLGARPPLRPSGRRGRCRPPTCRPCTRRC